MKNKLWLLGGVLLALLVFASPTQADVQYKINRYKADVTIHRDNTATFTQEITYAFSSSYHGQYVTLGTAGQMPDNFGLKPKELPPLENGNFNPSFSSNALASYQTKGYDYDYSVTKNGEVVDGVRDEFTNLGDGYALKIYNAGEAGDEVTVKVSWHLQNLLTIYQDIAVLNWKPISDWDVPLHNVSFSVHAPEAKRHKFYVHLGYFQPSAKIRQSDDTTRVEVAYLGKGKPLELYAYWETSAFSAQPMTDATYLNTFKAKEASIEQKTQAYRQQFFLVIPLAILALLVVATIFRLVYKAKVYPKAKGPKWLYQAPADLSPQVLAASVFSTDWLELNPTRGRSGQVTFENLVQATLLDLIDRGNLELEKVRTVLKLVHLEGLSEAEKQFIKMAFGGDKREVYLAHLFSLYKVNAKISVDNGYKASQVRRHGEEKVHELTHDLENLKAYVDDEIKRLGLPDFYRPLTALERCLRWLFIGLPLLAALVPVGVLGFLGVTESLTMANTSLVLAYLALFVLAFSFAGVFYWKSRLDGRDGAPRTETQETYQAWLAFRRMIKDIKTFERAELESIVVWNRILVYATLFGHAKDVEEVIKVNRIKVPPMVDDYLNLGMYSVLSHASHRFDTYGHKATAAQHFHVSSGSSSSGGFGGGGFSGGGGGGGGGAF